MEICSARKRQTPSLKFASNKKRQHSLRQHRGRRRTRSTISPSLRSLSTIPFLRSPLLSNPLHRLAPSPSRNRKPTRSPLDLLSVPRRPISSTPIPPPLVPLPPTAAHRLTPLLQLPILSPLPSSKLSLPSLPRLPLPLRPSSATSTLSSYLIPTATRSHTTRGASLVRRAFRSRNWTLVEERSVSV